MYDFSEEQLERYSRHILLREVGVSGQERLLRAKVLIIGAGGLGSPAALYLAAAGIATIGIADGDAVAQSNLQRQILYTVRDLGRPKTKAAKETVGALNPDVRVIEHGFFVDSGNISGTIKDYDYVIDGTDNFETKRLINDACVKYGKPFSYAGITGFQGQVLTYVPGSPCLSCVFPSFPDESANRSCGRSGVMGFVGGVIGSIQAAEAVKCLLGIGELLTGKLLVFDALTSSFERLQIGKNPACASCKGY